MNQIVTSDCKYLKFNVPYRYFLVCADLWSGQIFVVTVCSWRYHDRCWRKILDFDVYTAKKLFPKKQFHLRLLYSQCFEALIRVRNLPIDLRKGRPYKTLQIFISLIFFVFFCFFCSANKPLKRHGGSGNSSTILQKKRKKWIVVFALLWWLECCTKPSNILMKVKYYPWTEKYKFTAKAAKYRIIRQNSPLVFMGKSWSSWYFDIWLLFDFVHTCFKCNLIFK